jgi:hypothetical protein
MAMAKATSALTAVLGQQIDGDARSGDLVLLGVYDNAAVHGLARPPA